MKSKEEKELDNDAKIGKAGGADGGNTMGLGGMLHSGIGGATGGLTAGQVKDVEEALIENAKEAERQRKFLEKEAGGGYPQPLSPHPSLDAHLNYLYPPIYIHLIPFFSIP